MKQAQGHKVFANRPSGTAAVSAFTASMPTEITAIYVCNTTGSAVDFSIYHDDGSTFDQTTALFYATELAANETRLISVSADNAGILMRVGDQIGVQSSVANALNFTAYGITSTVRSQANG